MKACQSIVAATLVALTAVNAFIPTQNAVVRTNCVSVQATSEETSSPGDVAKGVALAALFSLSMVANPLPSFADGKFGQQILFIVDINLRITYLSLLKRRPNQ